MPNTARTVALLGISDRSEMLVMERGGNRYRVEFRVYDSGRRQAIYCSVNDTPILRADLQMKPLEKRGFSDLHSAGRYFIPAEIGIFGVMQRLLSGRYM